MKFLVVHPKHKHNPSVAGFQVSRVPRGFSCTSTRKTGPLSPNNNYCTMLRQYFEKTVPGVY